MNTETGYVYDTTRIWGHGKSLKCRIRGHGDITICMCVSTYMSKPAVTKMCLLEVK